MIVRNLEMRRGDLKPDLIVDLTDNDIPVVGLEAATSAQMIGVKNGVVLFNRAATLIGSSAAMLWQAADTVVPGTITVEVEVTWPGAKPQTFRAENKVTVLPDLA